MTRVCLGCKQSKSTSDFYSDKRIIDGCQARCKPCYKLIGKKYRQENEVKIRLKKVTRIYGITESAYASILASQKNTCGICFRPETRKIKGKLTRLSIDHCHKTGKVRGLLCADCNRAIGMLQDSPEVCKAAARYLENT